MRQLGKALKGAYLGLMLLFLYAPIILLIVFSFNSSKTPGNWVGFTLRWYGELVSNRAITDAIWVTLSIAVISSLVATVLGTAAAIGIHSMKKRSRLIVENVSQLPIMNPDLVTGISLALLFLAVGLRGGYIRLLIAHITFNIPYVLFSVLPRLRQSSNSLYEAALDLGCTPGQALWKVIVPDIWPSILSGFILAFTLSLDDFVISFFAGNGIDNLSMYIFSSAKHGVNPALSTIIFVPVVTLLLIVNLRSIKKEREEEKHALKTKRKI
ncbi:MAG: ABC transporter permease [Clostridiales bacterium]|nr:ABC transporter permease [Clostridiales bacterium]